MAVDRRGAGAGGGIPRAVPVRVNVGHLHRMFVYIIMIILVAMHKLYIDNIRLLLIAHDLIINTIIKLSLD